jgi:hypothetical protein
MCQDESSRRYFYERMDDDGRGTFFLPKLHLQSDRVGGRPSPSQVQKNFVFDKGILMVNETKARPRSSRHTLTLLAI